MQADILFRNGTILTMDEKEPVVEAVAVKGNRILAAGTTEEIETLGIGAERIVDLKGRSLTPGLIDTHYHIFLNGFFGETADAAIIQTGIDNCASIEDILDLVREAADRRPPGAWISMMGYDQNTIREQRHVTKEELDAAAPNHPVQCMRTCGHISIYNSKALESIGVYEAADAQKYPENEIVVEDGRLTGMVKDHTHFEIWSHVVYTGEQHRKAAEQTNRMLLSYGVTSMHDAGETDGPAFHMAQTIKKDGSFKPRVSMMLHSIFGKPFSLQLNEHFMELGFMTGLGDAQYRIGACKFMIDGGTSGPSCATREPYSHDPDLPGILGWERQEVIDYIGKIHDAGCQATAHAVGDQAIEWMIEGYEKACEKDPRKDLRHRIEHCAIVDEDLVRRMADLNLCPSVNPGFIAWNGANYTKYYGERMRYFAALRTMIDHGVHVSIGSDAPSGPLNPVEILDAAVNRIDRRAGVQTDRTQAVTLQEALRLYTVNGAYATHEEDQKGRIAPGMLADLVVWSEDLTKIDDADILELRVDQTWIDGVLEYEREV